jgi:secreted trypsin-like serine protease
MRLSALAALVAVAGCAGGATAPGAIEDEIIGGMADDGDPAVVVLYMTIPGRQGGALCTGEIVSPHVVLTAAHCAGGEDPTVTNATWRVYLGPDFSKATAADLLPAKEAHYHAQFDVNNLDGGYDVGVVVMQNALPATIKPLPYNRASIDAGFDGKAVRFVGYGLDNADQQTGAGVKRQTTTSLTDHSAMLLHFSDGAHETCNGDSGGPAFMSIGGQEVIVGLTSFGDVNCQQGGWDTRVDALASWIDGWVDKADPGFRNNTGTSGGNGSPGSTPPSPSGGTQAPPTSSATPMPPSSTGAGGVGASCVSSDCGVNGGCSMSTSGGSDTPNAAMVLTLVFGLWLKLSRTRKRN